MGIVGFDFECPVNFQNEHLRKYPYVNREGLDTDVKAPPGGVWHDAVQPIECDEAQSRVILALNQEIKVKFHYSVAPIILHPDGAPVQWSTGGQAQAGPSVSAGQPNVGEMPCPPTVPDPFSQYGQEHMQHLRQAMQMAPQAQIMQQVPQMQMVQQGQQLPPMQLIPMTQVLQQWETFPPQQGIGTPSPPAEMQQIYVPPQFVPDASQDTALNVGTGM